MDGESKQGDDDATERVDEASSAEGLEAKVAELSSTNEALRERVDELESIVAEIAPATRRTETSADDNSATEAERVADDPPTAVPSGGQSHKVVGKFSDSDGGVGVYGHNTASSGTTYGVWGEVDSSDGYGLYTPNETRAEGDVTTEDGALRTLVAPSGWAYLRFTEQSYSSGPRLYRDSTTDDMYFNGANSLTLNFPFDVGADANVGGTLQADTLTFGDGTPQTTAGPIAKASVNPNGSINSSTGVAAVNYVSSPEPHYEIELDGVDYSLFDHITLVTPRAANYVSTDATGQDPQLLVVNIHDDDSTQVVSPFQFAVFAGDGSADVSLSAGDSTSTAGGERDRAPDTE